MKIANPVPLFPTYRELHELALNDYPSLTEYLNDGPVWRVQHWHWAEDFLRYVGRNKSEHTYIRFRNDVERFLLWSFNVKDSAIDVLRKSDILEYIDFCVTPPTAWIGDVACERFQLANGVFAANVDWKPFRLTPKKIEPNIKVDKKKYRPSQQTIKSTFVALAAFYRHLMDEEICYGNPIPLAKRDCKHLIKDSQVKAIKRLTDEQWQFVLDAAMKMADNNPLYERHLFIIATMKTLFLRLSELSERDGWLPMMSHFWVDETNNWWFKAFGKGKKIRDITVPSGYLKYLSRYRQWRGLPDLPYSGEQAVLVEKIRGQGGLTSRQIARLVQEVFDYAHAAMVKSKGPQAALKLKEASTHYLRHTGASMEIERNRPLKDLSEDLGHASTSTTDSVYVQVERQKRAASGKDRQVD
ncbi:tyrosine-type recombinase/integrase [Alteromonadaceae bacterium BrNp21-10]|nr:tyrosine-type recombinase/integrase [Alteromonadaceae bacterium BrNp21-10]